MKIGTYKGFTISIKMTGSVDFTDEMKRYNPDDSSSIESIIKRSKARFIIIIEKNGKRAFLENRNLYDFGSLLSDPQILQEAFDDIITTSRVLSSGQGVSRACRRPP